MKLLALMLRRQQEIEDNSPQRTALRADVLRMIALLREAMGGGVAAKLAALLKTVVDNRSQIQRGIIAWVRLVEVLVQEAERGQRKGGGGRKKALVKAAAFRILNTKEARLPGIPPYLYPLVMDVAVEWMIEAIVQAENGYALWDSSPEADVWSPLADSISWLKQAISGVWQGVVRFVLTTYTAIKYREPLSPELEKALASVETTGLLADKNSALRSGMAFLKFVGDNGERVIAGVKLIFEAVQQAETFLELDGPGKKQYAHDLIIATLEDLGFPVGSGLFGLIASALIDTGIESAWSIFTERAPETFKHRSTSGRAVVSVGPPAIP
jgi:hypothetical protein